MENTAASVVVAEPYSACVVGGRPQQEDRRFDAVGAWSGIVVGLG